MRITGQSIAIAGTFVFLSAGLALGTASDAPSSGKNASNPQASLSDAQRMALSEAAHRQNANYLRDFVAKHGDPHMLPIVEVSTYAAPPQTLQAAVASASAIVIGRVSSTSFQSDPSGGMPLTTATLQVERTIKGPALSTMVVRQVGGPVAQGSGGALAVLDTDRLLLPGDHVLVMLDVTAGSYRPLAGAGVNIIRSDGTVQPEDSNPFAAAFAGKALAQVAATLGS